MMRKPKFEMRVNHDGKIYFQLMTAYNEIVLMSKGYGSRYEAIQGIAHVMRYGGYESRFVRRENAEGKFFFQLLSPSGRVLGSSPMYHSRQGRDNGIVAVRRAVQLGRVLDLN